MERRSQEKFGGSMRSGTVTFVTHKDRLSFYLEAASTTGFKVEKIAGEGEEYFSSRKNANVKLTGKEYIAVSIEKPEAAKDHTIFWDTVKSLDQKKV